MSDIRQSMRKDILNSGFKNQKSHKNTQSFETGLSEYYEMLQDKSHFKAGTLVGHPDFLSDNPKSERKAKTSEQKLNKGFQTQEERNTSEWNETYFTKEKEKLSDKLISNIK